MAFKGDLVIGRQTCWMALQQATLFFDFSDTTQRSVSEQRNLMKFSRKQTELASWSKTIITMLAIVMSVDTPIVAVPL